MRRRTLNPGAPLSIRKAEIPPRAPFLLVGHGHQDGEVGFLRPRNPDLAAIDNPFIAFAHRARDHCGRIGSRARLRNADRGDSPFAHIGLEIAFALIVIHCRHQHAQVG